MVRHKNEIVKGKGKLPSLSISEVVVNNEPGIYEIGEEFNGNGYRFLINTKEDVALNQEEFELDYEIGEVFDGNVYRFLINTKEDVALNEEELKVIKIIRDVKVFKKL